MSERIASGVRREWGLLLLALSFMTRLPLQHGEVAPEALEACRRYFSVAGAVIGAVMAVVFTVAASGLPSYVAVMLALVAGLLLTGGLHEDGLADTLDGIGGGWTPVEKLSIMKDSRLGSYGGVGLVASMGLRAALLIGIAQSGGWAGVCMALVLGHSASRAAPLWVMVQLPYARVDDSRVAALSHAVPPRDVAVATLVPLLLGLCLIGWITTAVSLLVMAATVWGAGRWLRAQLGGYTGDTLGAVQQCAELIGYTTWLWMMHA